MTVNCLPPYVPCTYSVPFFFSIENGFRDSILVVGPPRLFYPQQRDYKILFYQSVCSIGLLVYKSQPLSTNNRTSSCVDFRYWEGGREGRGRWRGVHQQIGQPGGVRPEWAIGTNGFGVFAWHARHQSPVATLASIRSSLDHPVETAVYRREGCQLYRVLSVTTTIVTSFKVSLCLSPLWFVHDTDNVTPTAAWRFNHREDCRSVIGSCQINHRQSLRARSSRDRRMDRIESVTEFPLIIANQ